MRPNEETDKSEPESIRNFRGRGWRNIWGLILLAFVVLLGVCAYWIIRLGFWGALDKNQLGYASFFAAVLGICLIGRWSIPNALLHRARPDIGGAPIDRRVSGVSFDAGGGNVGSSNVHLGGNDGHGDGGGQ